MACLWNSNQLLAAVMLIVAPAWGQIYRISTFAGGGLPPTPAPALQSPIAAGLGIAISPAGEIYFSSLNCVFKVDKAGTMTRFAGTGRPGYEGDGGAATKAQLNSPYGLAFDVAGNLYIADRNNNRVRKVTPSGVIATHAGSGKRGFAGDGGSAPQAELSLPEAVATGNDGSVYISDTFNNRIRKVAGEVITTVAGTGFAGYSGEGQATGASLNNPAGLKADVHGDLYVADYLNHRVRKISGNGLISTVAGTGTYGLSGHGGPATSAQLGFPYDIALDSSGNIFISQSGPTLKITGTTIARLTGDSEGLLARSLALDQAGTLYMTGRRSRLEKITQNGVVTAVVGDGTTFLGDNRPASEAAFGFPSSVALSPAGELYIADNQNNRIRKVGVNGIVTTVVGTGTQGFSGDGGPAILAELALGFGSIAFDATGNLYISDSANDRIRKVSTTGIITTLAGSGTRGYTGDGAAAIEASMNYPTSLAVDKDGSIYFVDTFNYRVRKISPAGGISLVAGNGIQAYSTSGIHAGFGEGEAAIAASFSSLNGIAVDGAQNLFIADLGTILKVSSSGKINKILGNGSFEKVVEGTSALDAAATAAFLAFDAQGRLFFAGRSIVRVISSAGLVTTVAGGATSGYSGDGGPATDALFQSPSSLAIRSNGQIFVADAVTNSVRLLVPVLAQSIAFDALADRRYDESRFSLSAKASSGLPVRFTSTTPLVCSISSTQVTLLRAGTCSVTATQEGDNDYNLAAPVARTFVIARGLQTITFSDLSNVPLGAPPFSIAATAAFGLPVAFAAKSPAICTILQSTVTVTGEGKCIIAASQAGSDNYLPAKAEGVFYVNGPVIKAGGVTPVYSSLTSIQPGSWISIYGTNLARVTAVWNSDFPVSLGEVSVTINGKAGYLWYVSPTQINLQAPDDTASGPVDLVLSGPGGVCTFRITLATASPSFSLFDATHVAGVILTPDGTGAYGGGTYDLLGPSGVFTFKTRPVRAGESLILFGVGFGATRTGVPAGSLFSGSAETLNPIAITLDGIPAQVLYSGMTSAGLYQFNLTMPKTGSGDLLLEASGNGVKLAGPSVAVQ